MKMRVTVDPAADRHIGDALEDSLQVILDTIQGNAIRIVPVDTAALQNDLKTEIDRDGAFLKGAVGSDLDYSVVVEKGRQDVPAYPIQPYLKPALYQTRGVRPR